MRPVPVLPVASARRALWLRLLACVLVALAAVVAAASMARLAESRQAALRELRIEEQRLERRARRLTDPTAGTVLAALEESRDALRVRIVEALGTARSAPGVRRLHHVVDEREMADTEDMVTLRLSLEGNLGHGAALLELLATVRLATVPWPTETRACRLQRLAAAGLLIDCAVDVLHWTRLRVPRER